MVENMQPLTYVHAVSNKRVEIDRQAYSADEVRFMTGALKQKRFEVADGVTVEVLTPYTPLTNEPIDGALVITFSDREDRNLITDVICWDEDWTDEAIAFVKDLSGGHSKLDAQNKPSTPWIASITTTRSQDLTPSQSEIVAHTEAALALASCP
jgi:hypothetical protein|tara:strand:- start:22842 stop:23303 length:462 start_codon:yes stop_codon:yes gene_type:complete